MISGRWGHLCHAKAWARLAGGSRETLGHIQAVAEEQRPRRKADRGADPKGQRKRRANVMCKPGSGKDEYDDQEGREGIERGPGQHPGGAHDAARKQVDAVMIARTRVHPVGGHRRKHPAGEELGQRVVPGFVGYGPVHPVRIGEREDADCRQGHGQDRDRRPTGDAAKRAPPPRNYRGQG